MTSTPLEASDPQRAAAAKRKVLERLTDVARHYRALEAAMAEFGDGFFREQFARAAAGRRRRRRRCYVAQSEHAARVS